MFEREGDTKYKSVCNSEDFQQRGANFLDWSEKLDLCVTILLISTEYILHFVVTAFLYTLSNKFFFHQTQLLSGCLDIFVHYFFFFFENACDICCCENFCTLHHVFPFSGKHILLLRHFFTICFLSFFVVAKCSCSILLAAFPSKCQGR